MKFESFKCGQVIKTGCHTVSEQEIVEFARQFDPQWFHTDPERARVSRWSGLIASGWHTCAIAMRLAVGSVLAESDSVGSPGVEAIRWLSPLRPGMQVQLTIEVLDKRVSRSGRIGIIRWRWGLTGETEVTVLELVVTSLFELATAPCLVHAAD